MGTRLVLLWIVLCSAPFGADAQPVDEGRRVVFADVAYASTADDEGSLGRGLALSGGFGYRISPRVTLQGIAERISYHRDVEWLAFDGRILFFGVEAAFQSTRRTVRPFATLGVGMFDDRGTWIQKTAIHPSLPRVEERVDRSYQLAAMTASGGVDFRVSDRASVRASVRFHGLVDTGDDLAPHTNIQPGIGVAWRW
jgi:hypothetical protein